jgi:hypothetical protein
MLILDDAAHDYSVPGWLRMNWASYDNTNGTVFPAVGDIDGDGCAAACIGDSHPEHLSDSTELIRFLIVIIGQM